MPDSTLHSSLYSAPCSKIKNISALERSLTTIDNVIIFIKTSYAPPSFQKTIWAVYRISCKRSTFYHTLVAFTVEEVFNISYKYQPPSNLAKNQYFYTRDFMPLFHFQKNLSIAEACRNIHFLLHFYYWMRSAIFEKNTKLPVI